MFKGITIRTKLLLSLGLIAVAILVLGMVVVGGMRTLEQNSTTMVALQKTHSEAQDIIWLDEVLTQSTRNYIFTGESFWKERYDSFGTKLDEVIKSAAAEASDITIQSLFLQQDEANLILVDLELKAHALVEDGKPEEALTLLDSNQYLKWKETYSNTINTYLSISRDNLLGIEAINEKVTNTVLLTFIGSFVLTLSIILLTGVVLTKVVSVYLSRSIKNVRNAAVEIARGNMDVKIDTSGKDEIAELARAIDKMRQSLKVVLEEYERKIK